MSDKNYQRIILNEWHNTGDDEYARYLFDLVADRSSGKQGNISLFLLCVICGFFVGLAITFFSPFSLELSVYNSMIIITGGIVTGGIIGLIGAKRQSFSLEYLFYLLTPKKPFHIFFKIFRTFNHLSFLSAGILLITWSLGVAIGSLSIGLVLAFYNLFTGSDPTWFSGDFAIFLFLGSAGIGFFLGSYFFGKAGWYVGSLSLLGFLLGDITAFIFFSLVLLSAGYFFKDFQLSKIIFVIGLAIAGFRFISSVEPIFKEAKTEDQPIHSYRAWWTWLSKKPIGSEVRMALQKAIDGNTSETATTWVELLKQLQKRIQQNPSTQDCIINLHNQDWKERFIARQVIRERAEETIVLADSVSKLICLDCFVRYYSHRIQLSNDHSITFYGCRECYEHTKFIEWSNPVVAVLDTQMSERFAKVDSSLLVNWLTHRSIFDFDWIEIKQATDEDVERLAIKFSNDNDDMRKSKHKTMQCVVDMDCKLSENSARILQKIFDHVVYT